MPESHVTLSGPPAVGLPLGVEVYHLAHECGAATLAFLRGSGWGKRELAIWLIARYEPLASYGPRESEDAPSSRSPNRSLEADLSRLHELIRDARRQTLKAIRAALIHGGSLDFAVTAVKQGDVVPARDTFGREGWVPVARPRMHLVDRVVSLVVAQRLTRPDEFAADWRGLGKLLEEIEVDERWNATG